MKTIMSLMLGLSLVVGATSMFAQGQTDTTKTTKTKKTKKSKKTNTSTTTH